MTAYENESRARHCLIRKGLRFEPGKANMSIPKNTRSYRSTLHVALTSSISHTSLGHKGLPWHTSTAFQP